MLAVLLRLLH